MDLGLSKCGQENQGVLADRYLETSVKLLLQERTDPLPFIEHLLLTRDTISLNPHHWEGETIITSKAIQPEVTVGIENQEYLIQGHIELFQHTSLSPLFRLLYLSPGERG